MLPIKRPLYLTRFKKHVADARKNVSKSDYVQASENVWGALSSLVNAWSIAEVTVGAVKKEKFAELYQLLLKDDPELKQVMLQSHFDSPMHFATKAEALHLYFLGKTDYPEDFMKSTLDDAVKVLREVDKVLSK